MKRLVMAVVCAMNLVACEKPPETVVETKPKVDPLAQELAAGVWAGLLHNSPSELTFDIRTPGQVLATMSYSVFQRSVLKDEFTVTFDADGTVHLKGAPTNKFVGGGKFLPELIGKLSADRNTLSGSQLLGDKLTIEWSLSKNKTLKDVDPPLSVLQGEAALTTAPWEGTVGNRPAKLVITKTSAGLNAVLTQGKDTTKFDVTLNPKGEIKMSAVARPTQQGLVKVTFNGYFGTRELQRVQGTAETTTTQGFVEQSNSETWMFMKARPEAEPKSKVKETKAKKKKK